MTMLYRPILLDLDAGDGSVGEEWRRLSGSQAFINTACQQQERRRPSLRALSPSCLFVTTTTTTTTAHHTQATIQTVQPYLKLP